MSPFYIEDEKDPTAKMAWGVIIIAGLFLAFRFAQWWAAGFPVERIP